MTSSFEMKRRSFPVGLFFRYLGLIAMAIIAIGPFLWLLSTALKGPGENIFAYPPQFIPRHPTLGNFSAVWQKIPMGWFLLNSIIVTLLTIALNLAMSVLAAYPLARMRFRGRQLIFLAILATMMIPFQVLMVPLYLICIGMNLTDSAGVVNGWLGLIAWSAGERDEAITAMARAVELDPENMGYRRLLRDYRASAGGVRARASAILDRTWAWLGRQRG